MHSFGAFLVHSQIAWRFSDTLFPDASLIFGSMKLRTSGRVLITVDTSGLDACVYTGTTDLPLCLSVGYVCYDAEFLIDPSTSAIYRLALLETGSLLIEQINNRMVGSTENLFFNTMSDTFVMWGSGVLSQMAIDYYHRWLVVVRDTNGLIYDIRSLNNPTLTGTFISLDPIDINPTSRQPLRIHRGKFCACGSAGKILCYEIRAGKLKIAQFVLKLTALKVCSAVKVFNDYILVTGSGLGLAIFNTTDFSHIGSTIEDLTWTKDFLRSDDTVILSANDVRQLRVLDISDPRNIKVIFQANATRTMNTLFMNNEFFFSTANGANNVISARLLNFTFPSGYEEFYRRSEWYMYSSIKNTLVIDAAASTYQFLYGEAESYVLKNPSQDNWLPTDVDITYVILTLPTDFSVERSDASEWVQVKTGSKITQLEFNSNLIRIRDLQLNMPLDRNLDQFVRYRADNGRGSILIGFINVTRFYMDGTACPDNAICSSIRNTKFECKSGFTLNSAGTSCVTCPEGQYKLLSGNDACKPCPEFAECSSLSIKCTYGTTLKKESCIKSEQTTFFENNSVVFALAGIFVAIICFTTVVILFWRKQKLRKSKLQKQLCSSTQITAGTTTMQTNGISIINFQQFFIDFSFCNSWLFNV